MRKHITFFLVFQRTKIRKDMLPVVAAPAGRPALLSRRALELRKSHTHTKPAKFGFKFELKCGFRSTCPFTTLVLQQALTKLRVRLQVLPVQTQLSSSNSSCLLVKRKKPNNVPTMNSISKLSVYLRQWPREKRISRSKARGEGKRKEKAQGCKRAMTFFSTQLMCVPGMGSNAKCCDKD